jgi:hypothetical protein
LRASPKGGTPFHRYLKHLADRRTFMQRYRRLMVSLGWLAAFLMAVGAGWKNS